MNQTDKLKNSDVISGAQIVVYFSDFLKGFKKFWWVIVALAVLISGFKFLKTKSDYVPIYSSTATFTVSTQTNTSSVNGISAYSFYYDSSTVNQLIKTFPYIMRSNVLRDAICEDLDVPAVPAEIVASSSTGSNMFTITAKGRDPQLTYDTLMSAIENYPNAAKHVVGKVKLQMITTPTVATEPANSSDAFNQAVKGLFMGALLGFVWILFYALQRKTIKVKKDITTQLNSEALGVVPQVSFKQHTRAINNSLVFTNENVGMQFMESFRVLRNVVLHALQDGEKVIMATSTAPNEGKTTVITNLAMSLGAYGKKVLLVDADLRHPSVASLLKLNENMLSFSRETEDYRIADLEEYKISFMSISLGGNVYKFVNTKQIKNILADVKDEYDIILVDTPPCGLVSDTMYIAQASDAAIYIIKQDGVRVSKVRSGLDTLMSTNTNILGCVINAASVGLSGYGSANGYGYGYGKYGYGKYGYGKYGYGESRRHSRHRRK